MKKTMMMGIMMLIGTFASAQEKAFWVVETNTGSDDRSIVRIYDSGNQLLHEATVDRKINISKRKERKRLDQLAASASHESKTVVSARKKYSRLPNGHHVTVE